MGTSRRSLPIVIPLSICIVLLHSTSSPGQQVTKADAARDGSDRSQSWDKMARIWDLRRFLNSNPPTREEATPPKP